MIGRLPFYPRMISWRARWNNWLISRFYILVDSLEFLKTTFLQWFYNHHYGALVSHEEEIFYYTHSRGMLFERVFKFGECLGFVFLAMHYRTLSRMRNWHRFELLIIQCWHPWVGKGWPAWLAVCLGRRFPLFPPHSPRNFWRVFVAFFFSCCQTIQITSYAA